MAQSAAARTSPDARAFRVFACLWAIGALFDSALLWSSTGALRNVPGGGGWPPPAVWVLARPSLAPFLVLNAALALQVFLLLPHMTNHGMLVLLIGVTFPLCALRLWLSEGREAVRPERLYASAAPCIRWMLIAMYFWAVVHKLNHDFFSPALSCGPVQLHLLQDRVPWLPSGTLMVYFSIYGTLLVEAAIPLLLVFRRTRVLGMLLAAGFHFALGFRYTGFSATLFALLSLFSPPALYDALAPGWPRFSPGARLRRASVWLSRFLSVWIGGLALAFLATLVVAPDHHVFGTGPPLLKAIGLRLPWLFYGGALLALLATAAWRSRNRLDGAPSAFRIPSAALAALPLLAFANGLAPHLGLKNTQVYAMYSNLNTGGGRSNHLFLPASWQLFDTLGDAVTVLASSDPMLARLAEGPSWRPVPYFDAVLPGARRLVPLHDPPSWRIPYQALRRRVSQLREAGVEGIDVTYERGGEVKFVGRAERDPELSSLSYLRYKLVNVRAFPDRGFCMW